LNGKVYKATNKLNGKMYIGITTRMLCQRKAKHFYSARTRTNECTHFCNAIRKYGEDVFEWSIIEENIEDFNELLAREQYYIKKYNSVEDGYNLSYGGKGSYGYKWNEEDKAKQSETLKEYFINNPESAKNRKKHDYSGKNNPMFGKRPHLREKRSIEDRNRMSAGRMGMKFTEQHKENLSKSHKGIVITEEQKQKISLSLRGENAPSSKLTWNDVHKIRNLKSKGINNTEISNMFSVNKSTIGKIVNNQTWIEKIG